MMLRGNKEPLWALFTNTRQLMAHWHAIHIPSGIVLLTATFYHIGAALYYAPFLR